MASQHILIAGAMPADGEQVTAELNRASQEGYIVAHTCVCAIDEENAYYIATLVRPVADPPRQGIGMGEHRKPQRAPVDVSKVHSPQQASS